MKDNPFTPAHKATVALMALLQKSNAPLNLHDKIIAWAKLHFPCAIAANLASRKTMISFLYQRYNLGQLSPVEVSTHLPYTNKTVGVVRTDPVACVYSLLTNPALMKESQLLFDVNDPLGNCDISRLVVSTRPIPMISV